MNGWKVSAPKALIRTTPEGTSTYRLRRSRILDLATKGRLPQSLERAFGCRGAALAYNPMQ
jgi:hypothetical protein